MKRSLICGVMSLLAASAALQALADPSPPMDRRPPGMAKPVGPPSHGPGRPGGGPAPRPPVRPPTPRPPQNGHHPRPPAGRRPGIRPIYGQWNGHRLRVGQFRYPPGYAYRRWAIGQTLPQLLFSSAYYFADYASLGLDAPPWGYQWVRYGPDVILVNLRTGEVLDVVSGVFY